MTIKEISSFTGKTERTIQRWVGNASVKMSSIKDKMSSSSPLYPADYFIDEVEYILLSGSMSKDAVSILMQNARRENLPTIQPQIDYELIGKMIGVAITAAMTPLLNQLQNNKPQHLQIEYVPEIPIRKLFVNKVNEYAKVSKMKHDDAFKEVYNYIGMTFGIRVMARAKNRNIKGIEVLIQDGYLEKSIIVIDRMIRKELI